MALHLYLLGTLAVLIVGRIAFFIIGILFKFIRSKRLLQNKYCYHVGVPFIGLAAQLWKVNDLKDLYYFLDRIFQMGLAYKKNIVSMWIFHRHFVGITDPHIAEKVLSSPDAVEKTPEYHSLAVVGDGIFIARVEKWKKLRRAINKTFTTEQLDFYFDNTVVDLAIKCSNHYGKTTGYTDVLPLIGRYFLDLIFKTHFGLETNELDHNRFDIMPAISKMLDVGFRIRAPRPYYHNDTIFKLSKYYKPLMEQAKILYRPIEIITREKYPEWKLRREKNGGKPVNFNMLDHYFQAVDELNMPQCEETYNKLMADIIIAGTDTTAYATCGMIYFLAANPDCQEKAYKEIKEHFPNEKIPLTRISLNELSYLEMCAREAIRHVGPPGVFRQLSQDLPAYDNCTIPKGTTAYVYMEYIHMNPVYYKYPKKFYPEHFLPEAVAARPKMTYFPFSYGPRICPGINYGMQAMKAVVFQILRQYHIETDLPFEQVDYKLHFMKEFTQGYPVKFTKRKD